MSGEPKIENFEIVERLGQGGMATVWKARQASLDRLVAIKILAPTFATDPADVERFRDEARAAGRLKHPGIVQVYDANFSDGCYRFVMELVDGYTVGEWIRRKQKLSESDALTVAESVVAALDYAWSSFRIIHCDVKAENIMVDADGTVKITDLGLARAISAMQNKEAATEVLGTPAYMAPEQVTGESDLDCRVDIYALGATLYHMVTGHTLFAGDSDDDIMQKQLAASVPSPAREVPELSSAFVQLLVKLLAKDRTYRPSDWQEVRTDLRLVRNNQPPLGEEPPPGYSTIFPDAEETIADPSMAPKTERVSDAPRAQRRGRLLPWLAWLLVVAAGAAWMHLAKGRGDVKESNPAAPVANVAVASPPPPAAVPTAVTAKPVAVDVERPSAPEAEPDETSVLAALNQQLRNLLSSGREQDAAKLLEDYHGPRASETAAWRQQQAQAVRAMVHRERGPAADQPARPVVTADEARQQMCRRALRQGIEPAMHALDALCNRQPEIEDQLADLRQLLRQAMHAQRAVLDSFNKDIGNPIALPSAQNAVLRRMSEKGLVVRLPDGTERTITIDQLDVQDRLRRLSHVADNPGVTLLKGLWACRSHANDRAKSLFGTLPTPINKLLISAADEQP